MEKNSLTLISIVAAIVIILSSVTILDNSISGNDMITSNEIIPSRVALIPMPPAACNFTMNAGWNMVSFYCLGMWADRDLVLAPVAANYEKIFIYDNTTSPTDPWMSYNPSLPNWTVQQLTSMNRFSGYWIYLNRTAGYYYNGSRKDSTIPLHAGWNLVSYPSVTERNMTDALGGIPADVVKTYDNPTGTMLIYVPGDPGNTLSTMQTYRGYWIHMSADGNWVVSGS